MENKDELLKLALEVLGTSGIARVVGTTRQAVSQWKSIPAKRVDPIVEAVKNRLDHLNAFAKQVL